MTTKKKNSSDNLEGKAYSFGEARRQDRRMSELWDQSSPTMQGIFDAVTGLRESFDAAQNAVEGFVSESRRVAHQLREEDCEAKANALDGWADEWEAVALSDFRLGATKLVDLVSDALVTGYSAHVITVAKRVSGRDKAEWVRLCGTMRFLVRADSPVVTEEQSEGRKVMAVWLIESLTRINSCAEGLTPEQVIKAANNPKITSAPGFAGEVARLCGAWDYQDQQVAKKAFEQAMKRGE